MGELIEIVESLDFKISKLLQKIENLQKENQELKKKNIETQLKVSSQEVQIRELMKDYDSIKMTNSLLGSDEYKRDTKLKINSLIREIDYCIAQLSD